MAHELAVWLFRHPIGTLTVAEGKLQFQYLPAWLARSDARALSHSLPLQTAPFSDHATRPFFAGLLPESDLRRLIAQQLHVSRQNDFALLEHMGGECAGAVTLFKPGQTLPSINTAEEVQWLTELEVAALLQELPRRPMLVGRDGLRLSLAGAQDKLPVVVQANRIGLPRNGTPSSHILKPAIPTLEDSVMNEYFCMTLAKRMQLHPAQVQIQRLQNSSFLLVERYDRVLASTGQLQRLHQEDFCQALGIIPELKYQNEGGPDLAQCFELVRQVTRPSAPQIVRLLDYVIFNALIGNHDAHAKNFSLLYTSTGLCLAPLYDALSTAVYPHLTHKMAMKLGSKYVFDTMHARHWTQFAQAAKLSVAQTHKRVLALAQQLPLAAQKLAAEEKQCAQHPLIAQIVQLITQRAAQIIKRF